MVTKEEIYDTEILPVLNEQIFKICKEHNIDFIASFLLQADEEDYITGDTIFQPTDINRGKIFQAVFQSFNDGVFNIDKFLLWLTKEYDCSQSLFLHDYGKNK